MNNRYLFRSISPIQTPIPCQAFTSKLPKMAQPDLDFTAPEVQTLSSCSAMSDMFSLGLMIASLYNNGRSLIESNLNTSHYSKQLDSVRLILTLYSYLSIPLYTSLISIYICLYLLLFYIPLKQYPLYNTYPYLLLIHI